MIKKTVAFAFPAILVLFVASSAFGQSTTTPAKHTCDQELSAWFAPLDLLTGSPQTIPYPELQHREDEMLACFAGYPKSAEANLYTQNAFDYELIIGRRAVAFINRHGLGAQFLSEDVRHD